MQIPYVLLKDEKTTLHGPKRIYEGKRFAQLFWLVVFCTSFSLLIVQIVNLIKDYKNNPTVSSVEFIVDERGIPFPLVTICNFNPIKLENMERINRTGDFPMDLLDYILESKMDATALYSTADRYQLQRGHVALIEYWRKYPAFTIDAFYNDVGFSCEDLLISCSFGSRQFLCCKYSRPVLTNMGKCYQIDLSMGPDWMKKQISAGAESGLEVLLDARQEDQQIEEHQNSAIYSTNTENGFRFFIHDHDKIPNLGSLAISVGPSMRIYTALSTKQYSLLKGFSCTDKWPKHFNASRDYSVVTCETFCKATYFNLTCGCSPSLYNIDFSFRTCLPLEIIDCMDSKMGTPLPDGTVDLNFPLCEECMIECDTWVYDASNSYGAMFNPGSLRLIHERKSWKKEHVKDNFATMNVFFRDLTHIQYKQHKASTITQLLSNIGGNMGLFLGMSLVTITECVIYLTKIFWIIVDNRRRKYLFKKVRSEKAKEEEVQETVKGFHLFRSLFTRTLPTSFRPPQYVGRANHQQKISLPVLKPSI